MTGIEIAHGLVSFQTLCFHYDEDTIMVGSKEGNENFHKLIESWVEKYKFKGGNYPSIEMDAIAISSKESDSFFLEYPQLKRQLEINDKYGYEIWTTLPEDLRQEEVDIIHTVELTYIPINIWDDYHEDGYVPEGEKQETYAYVEDSDLSHELRKQALEFLMNYIKEKKLLPEVDIILSYYDSKKKYPGLIGTENEWCLFERWELRFDNLTHESREKLVQTLQKEKITFDDNIFSIYSES